MRDTHFNDMKSIGILIGLIVFMAMTSCKKLDEVPPRTGINNIIREYVLPKPTVLTNEEREQVKQERQEYEKL